jgi:hypothetical protein
MGLAMVKKSHIAHDISWVREISWSLLDFKSHTGVIICGVHKGQLEI